MSDCCNKENNSVSAPRKFACPENKNEYVEVSFKTVLHHIKFPWLNKIKEQPYYFCHDPACDVVYFGLDGSVILKSEVRTIIGIKERNPEALICYCFGVNKSNALQFPEIKTYVMQKTREHLCSCDTSNPSGRCCLNDFPKIK